MKKTMILTLLLSISINLSFAQQDETIRVEYGNSKSTMFGINPLGLLLNMYSGHLGIITNNGANEINIPFFYWSPLENLTLIGGGLGYRFYKDGNGKGRFFGATVDLMYLTWDIETWSYDSNYNLVTQTETVETIGITPGVHVGYRWAWNNGFTLAPTIGVAYTVGEAKDSSGNTPDFNFSGFGPTLGIGLAYMF